MPARCHPASCLGRQGADAKAVQVEAIRSVSVLLLACYAHMHVSYRVADSCHEPFVLPELWLVCDTHTVRVTAQSTWKRARPLFVYVLM